MRLRAERIEIEPFHELIVTDHRGSSAVDEHGEAKITGDIPIEKMYEYMDRAKDRTLKRMKIRSGLGINGLLFLPYTRLQISQCLLKDIDVYVLETEGKKWMDGSKKQYMRSLSS